ncbi:MAG: helix-turn-helix domain-containing protein [Clostridiaceae bacterium]|uniref:Hypothetical cytosolic protein n=1 Tax=Syntrophus aciditrophicus (strain SB) TaxID=56780 RepID=Q2LV82_SYNAS|nr:helix-turn-helix domain-containing protein [Syntrophus aciditrophicus]ABC77991.1 hypothetical cytosolic protein [Syntrophus aciditrophicus SB]NLE25330.1 helix-turn-helix domain-containing protein [Clostridiaceae bacterium]
MNTHSESELQAKNLMIDDGFWNIEDLSNYLKVKIKTLYAMTSDIPHYRVGKLIRFKKQEIDTWMENKKVETDVENKNKSISLMEKRQRANFSIDRMIRRAIDQSKDEAYNAATGNQTGSRDPQRR